MLRPLRRVAAFTCCPLGTRSLPKRCNHVRPCNQCSPMSTLHTRMRPVCSVRVPVSKRQVGCAAADPRPRTCAACSAAIMQIGSPCAHVRFPVLVKTLLKCRAEDLISEASI